jgi:hypothetical protein
VDHQRQQREGQDDRGVPGGDPADGHWELRITSYELNAKSWLDEAPECIDIESHAAAFNASPLIRNS